MNNTNWDLFKCRCSGIHKIMANKQGNAPLTENQKVELLELEQKEKIKGLTGPQKDKLTSLYAKRELSKEIVLSDTCIEYLMEVYAWETQGMVAVKKEMEEIDQLEKGKMVEEESITLLSVVEGTIFYKNEERVTNDFLSGEPDVFVGDNVMNASKITDIKNSFDYPTFLKKINKGLENGWEEQVQGYCDITGATEGEIAHCLCSMPLIMQGDYKKKMFYKGNYATEEAPEFKKKWELLERSMNFNKIPIERRLYRIKVDPFTEVQKQQVYDRVKACRDYLWKFHEQYEKMNLSQELVPSQ